MTYSFPVAVVHIAGAFSFCLARFVPYGDSPSAWSVSPFVFLVVDAAVRAESGDIYLLIWLYFIVTRLIIVLERVVAMVSLQKYLKNRGCDVTFDDHSCTLTYGGLFYFIIYVKLLVLY